MFDEALYSELRRTSFYKRYVLYCVIGASAFFIIGAVTAALAFIFYTGDYGRAALILLIPSLICFAVPAGFAATARKKPYICAKGTLLSKSGGRAQIQAGAVKVNNAVSFEKFLNNASLDNYSAGDEVVLVSFTKKHARPMFYKA